MVSIYLLSDDPEGFQNEINSLQIPEEERHPFRRSKSSQARLFRQYSQECRDDIQLTLKSTSFESALQKSKNPAITRSQTLSTHKSYPEAIDFGDGNTMTVVAINGPINNLEEERAFLEKEKSGSDPKLTAPQNSVDDNVKGTPPQTGSLTESPVFHHRRVNSAQRRKEFASSVRRAKQLIHQEVGEGSQASSGSQCRSCGSWCSMVSVQSESRRDSLNSCFTCSPRLLSSKESGFSRSMDFTSLELSQSRKCSRCSQESDETGLGMETASLSSHRHHHSRHGKYKHHHKHRHSKHRHGSSSSNHRHHSTGQSQRSSRDISSLSIDLSEDEIFKYRVRGNSQYSSRRVHRSDSRSSRHSSRSHHRHRHRSHKHDRHEKHDHEKFERERLGRHFEKEYSRFMMENSEYFTQRDKPTSRSHRALSRTDSNWMEKLSVGQISPHSDHLDFPDMYNGHRPLEQTRSDTSSEMQCSPKPRIYKVKSLDLKPQGHYKRTDDSSHVFEPAPQRSPRHRREKEKDHEKFRSRSPETDNLFVDPAEVLKQKAIQIIEAEMVKHSSSGKDQLLHVPYSEPHIFSDDSFVESSVPSTKTTDNEHVSSSGISADFKSNLSDSSVMEKLGAKKMSRSSVASMSVDSHSPRHHKRHKEKSYAAAGRRSSAGNVPLIELTKRTPSGHFEQISMDDEHFSEPGMSLEYSSSYDTSPDVPLSTYGFRFYPGHSPAPTSRSSSRRSSRRSSGRRSRSREISRASSPISNKNPMRDSAYQSKEQSTEKAQSKPSSKTVSPTLSSSLGSYGASRSKARDDSNIHYSFNKSSRYAIIFWLLPKNLTCRNYLVVSLNFNSAIPTLDVRASLQS